MITDRERKNREELFKLMQENPELPVVAMVDSEIVQDDGYSRWMGAWGSSSIEEYFIGEERIHFREEDDFDEVEETLTDGQVCYDDFEAMSNIRKEQRQQEAAERLAVISRLIPVMKQTAELAGFEVVGRITLKDKETGKEYR